MVPEPAGYAGGSRSPELVRLALAVVQPGFEGLAPPEWLRRRLDDGLGGVGLFARNIADAEQVARLTGEVHALNPHALVAVDEEGGDVTRLEHGTGSSWPGNLALGAADDVELTERVAAEMGALLASVGIDLDYAPDADVNVEAANPVIGVRSFGSDAALVARHTAAWVRGLQGAGVLACAKHFPGHGDTRVDSHLAVPEVELGEPSGSPALEPFRSAAAAGAAAVMSAHIRVRDVDERPATLVPSIMTGLLRDEVGFHGLAVSDGLEMGAIAGPYGLAEGAVQAVAAGVDALCIGGGLAGADTLDLVVAALVDAVADGRLEESRLVQAAERVGEASRLRDSLRANAADRSSRATGARGGAGLEAAARALSVRGTPTVSPDAPTVLVLSGSSNIAVGDETRPGLVTAVRRRWPEAAVTAVGAAADTGPLLAGAVGHPLWVVVRDAHRFGWMGPLVADLATGRPDLVVVDTGWPGWAPDAGVVHVVTHGASWASGEAVVRLLAGA